MFIIYKRNNQRCISWKASRCTMSEMAIIQLWAPDKADEVATVFSEALKARKEKLNIRHELENKVIETLELVSSIIEAKEGFRPIFFKEED